MKEYHLPPTKEPIKQIPKVLNIKIIFLSLDRKIWNNPNNLKIYVDTQLSIT